MYFLTKYCSSIKSEAWKLFRDSSVMCERQGVHNVHISVLMKSSHGRLMHMVNIWNAPRFVQLSDKLCCISFGKRTKTDDKLIDETD